MLIPPSGIRILILLEYLWISPRSIRLYKNTSRLLTYPRYSSTRGVWSGMESERNRLKDYHGFSTSEIGDFRYWPLWGVGIII
jgi:hypothetical protein